MSTPNSPHGPVERAQVVAAISPQGSVQFDFRERLGSIDSDLTDTEREGERLARKLNKRLSGGQPSDVVTPSDYFMDKLTKWHSNKKVEKLKALLAAHLPRLKHLEQDVVSSATCVHESKEIILKQALALLGLVDQQIEYYQHHMNFLDDVINDIRQCDFTLVREIGEMKTAFAFWQELDSKQANGVRSTTPQNPCAILLKIGTDSTGHVPGKRILEDDAKVLGFSNSMPPTACEDLTASGMAVPVVVQAPRSVRNDIVNALPELAAVNRKNSNAPLPDSDSATTDATASMSAMALDTTLDNRDGAEYKRKCLKSQAVDLQLLNLEKFSKASGARHSHSDGHAEPKKTSTISPSSFMRSVGEKLSEFAHFPKASPPPAKKGVEKHRSWSVSGAHPSETISVDASDSNKSNSFQESTSGKNRVTRSPSLGSVFFPPHSNLEFKPLAASVTTEKRSGPAPLVHHTTPRPASVGHVHHHPVPVIPLGHDASHKVDGGIAFEGVVGAHAPVDANAAHHLTALGIMAHGHGSESTTRHVRTPSFSGQLSTSSSCSNLSHSSGNAPPPSAQDAGERLRSQRLSALRNHYPNLYQVAQAHADPGVKLLARKLNKCLMFKDELKRSLVKAELVQETENSCLCKMRKVQHELQDIMIERGGQCGVYANGSTNGGSPFLTKPSSSSHSISGSSSTFLSSLSIEHTTSAGTILQFPADLTTAQEGASSPGKLAQHPLMAQISHLSDHDFSSTDDEHDHLTNSNTSTQSRDTSFSQMEAASPRANGDHGVIEPLARIPSDPTIIDPSQDAAVNQTSYELFDVAHRCAEQLRFLLEEEDEAVDKVQRVRTLLTSAEHIDRQLLTTLAAK